VALNFLTRGANVFTIPKASNPEHVRENGGSCGWEMPAGDVQRIERAFPAPAQDVPLGML
jgi:diketogulonate reductase-like aldo/keto reductase